jgi:hypothetical protein
LIICIPLALRDSEWTELGVSLLHVYLFSSDEVIEVYIPICLQLPCNAR